MRTKFDAVVLGAAGSLSFGLILDGMLAAGALVFFLVAGWFFFGTKQQLKGFLSSAGLVGNRLPPPRGARDWQFPFACEICKAADCRAPRASVRQRHYNARKANLAAGGFGGKRKPIVQILKEIYDDEKK